MGRTHRKEAVPKESTHFCYTRKDVGDVKQAEKSVPDLVESKTRPTCLVKEELRSVLFQMDQFRCQIMKNQGLTHELKVPNLVCRSPLAHFEAAHCKYYSIGRGTFTAD